jgi:leucyl-tRNA synthetase
MHKTIRRVSEDIERLHFNTMLAALMEYGNYLTKIKDAASVPEEDWKEAIRTLLRLLAPTAPHFAEEIWARLGYGYSIHDQRWPQWDAELAKDEEIPLVVQVNGKVRDKLMVSASITEDEAKKLALESDKVKAHTEGKTVTQVIYVPGRLVNVVVR